MSWPRPELDADGPLGDLARLVAVLTCGPGESLDWPLPRWEALGERPGAHGVSALVLERLAGRPGVPEPVVAALRLEALTGAARQVRVAGQLRELLTAAGFPVAVLKGPCLAELVYARPSQRTFGDLDLLIRREDAGEALALAARLGYRLQCPESPIEPGHHHLPAYGRPGGVPVEWHLSLAPLHCAPGLDSAEVEGLWSRTVPATLAGAPALVLAPEDLLLHLCLHWAGANGCGGGLRPILDLAAVCRRWPMDWPSLAGRAERWGATRACALGLALARDWLGAPVGGEWHVPDALCARVVERVALANELAVGPRLAQALGGRRAAVGEALAPRGNGLRGWLLQVVRLARRHGPAIRALAGRRARELRQDVALARWLGGGRTSRETRP